MLVIEEQGNPKVINFQTLANVKYDKIVLQKECTFYLTDEGLYSRGNW